MKICRPNIFMCFANCGPNFLANLKLSQIRKFFLSNGPIFLFKIKNMAKQTSGWILDGFDMKGPKRSRTFFSSFSSYGKNFGFAMSRLAIPRDGVDFFCDLRINPQKFRFSILRICKQQNLQICDCRMTSKFADLWLQNDIKNLQICDLQSLH